MEDTRLPKRLMFGELVGGAVSTVGQEKEWIDPDKWTIAAQDEAEWLRTAKQGAERFMTKWIAEERAGAALRHAETCPNVTGRAKERVALGKRACTGLLKAVG